MSTYRGVSRKEWDVYKEKYLSSNPMFRFPPDHVGGEEVEFNDGEGNQVRLGICQSDWIPVIEVGVKTTKKMKSGKYRTSRLWFSIPASAIEELRLQIERLYYLDDHIDRIKLERKRK